ncbi:hypothetical protein [Metabacillus idriensis]|uniref:hypothetical protein n=1 Tax=Metabacillus idriensis TaxID=324768 RepID=UPI001CD5F2C5|nr:hypothetical protein [Metabacillus idriensis]
MKQVALRLQPLMKQNAEKSILSTPHLNTSYFESSDLISATLVIFNILLTIS